ncbi:uncharacterized protein MONOS_5147 [Monocercomonoides exilis]|uniref:uncharacterized protein n=1 Tax=Monocercomonoides exilis TaxID=2049356 RepID=UPI003559EA7F|nr:hypothetical protein MONOS_5147 [Monocercomonoides exilis]|eukprot:MONOS_5147.1-p1 / transcript=MONOS_5147.1 / gene=MONOS_5147 / organism=Monocercomonoides_exilis_PA203 / gene_product=unspecified product / transcript_product=unspecified product / location=Mono_scaffold00147:2032-3164(-) / protein_length=256 / sequence_SO=supercontig / SO=protein_coding / is_pseudo=false
MNKTDLKGYERVSCNQDYAIPLTEFLTSFSESGYVGSEADGGYDHSGCGFSFAPCHTISKVVELRFGSVIDFGDIAAVELRGQGTLLFIAGCTIEGIESQTSHELIHLIGESSADIKMLTVNGTTLESGSVISIEEGNGIKILSSELSNVTRNNGNGSVFSGVIGQGKRVEISNFVFSKAMCQGEIPFGGMGAFNVSNGGELIFTLNRVESCAALGAQGYGGGLHLNFDVNVQYSMKSNTFTRNLASKKNDLFLL